MHSEGCLAAAASIADGFCGFGTSHPRRISSQLRWPPMGKKPRQRWRASLLAGPGAVLTRAPTKAAAQQARPSPGILRLPSERGKRPCHASARTRRAHSKFLRPELPTPDPVAMRSDNQRRASMLEQARELAARGHYALMIEALLMANGFPEAAEWIDQPHIRKELKDIADGARKQAVGLPTELS